MSEISDDSASQTSDEGILSPLRPLASSLIEYSALKGALILFGLFLLGWIILTAHLSSFGIRIGAVVSFEFIAAALCYIGFLLCVGFPAWILIHAVAYSGHNIFRDDSGASRVGAVLLLWNVVLGAFVSIYFPTDLKAGVHVSWSTFLIFYIAGAHLTLLLFTRFLARSSKLHRILSNSIWLGVYVTGIQFYFFILRPGIDGEYVFTTLFLYVAIFNVPFFNQKHWDQYKRRTEVQVLIVIAFLLALLANAIHFGQKQYGYIPRTLGGGKPSVVFLRLRHTADTAEWRPQGFPFSADLLGPVLLLFRSDAEICVMPKDDLGKAEPRSLQLKSEMVDAILSNPAKPVPVVQSPQSDTGTACP